VPEAAAKPIRVCYLIDNLAVGGTEKQLLALIAHLDRSQVQPYLCLLDGTSDSSRTLEPAGCTVLRLGVKSLKSVRALSAAWRFVRFLRQQRIDVVQLHFPDSTYFGAPLARLAGVRSVFRTRRNTGYWMTPRHRRAGRIISHLVDGTIANSEACRQAVIEQEGARPESVYVIPNGIDLERFRSTGAPRGQKRTMRRVGVLASLRPVKRLDTFIKSAALLAPHFPDVEFHIAGEGECRASLTQLIADLQIGSRVRLLGAVEDVASFLSGLDVAVLCSATEGMSNSVLEYMAAGRPIVATRGAADPCLVQHRRTGFIAESETPKALAAAIAELLTDVDSSRQLGIAARDAVEANFSRTNESCRYTSIYTRIDSLPI
jgi:glycosyltransferase involved in cell wall biosynthesis